MVTSPPQNKTKQENQNKKPRKYFLEELAFELRPE
jgi:hypothetical protein